MISRQSRFYIHLTPILDILGCDYESENLNRMLCLVKLIVCSSHVKINYHWNYYLIIFTIETGQIKEVTDIK